MNRVYLPLLPLPVLALLVAFSACSKPGTEEVSHVIPPPSILAPAAQALALAPPAQAPAPGTAPVPAAVAARADDEPAGDDTPSDEEVKAFERPVMK